jgi:hypothetical protein
VFLLTPIPTHKAIGIATKPTQIGTVLKKALSRKKTKRIKPLIKKIHKPLIKKSYLTLMPQLSVKKAISRKLK